MKRIPAIMAVMTPFPYSIDGEADISEALAMMHEHRIQHLPVMEHGKLVGLLWDRDIRVAKGLQANLPTEGVPVGKVCNRQPFVVDITERLDHVVLQMAERRAGAAIVLRGEKLAGILTTTDVCRLLGETLREQARMGYSDDGDAA